MSRGGSAFCEMFAGLDACIGQCLVRILPCRVRVRLRLATDRLGGRLGIRADRACVLLRGRDVVVGRPLGKDQHLQRLALRVRVHQIIRLIRYADVVRGRRCKQSLDSARHPTISHDTTSVRPRSCAVTCANCSYQVIGQSRCSVHRRAP